jgi:hypothetical protein
MHPRTPTLLLTLLVLVTLPAAAQGRRPDRWQAVMENGDIAWDFRLVALKDDRLSISQGDSLSELKVGDITELRLIQPSEMQIGTGAVGGATGALTGADDLVFDMRPLDFAERLRVVQQVMVKYPPQEPAGAR